MTRRKIERKDEDYFANLLNEGERPTQQHQGVSREIITQALARISLNTSNMIDAVFCLLDNEFPSLFGSYDGPLSHGATTGQIGCYVGIFLNSGKKLDREGRDYWIKPLTEAGLIEKIVYDSSLRNFLPGHLKAKSPSSSYRLNNEFVELLRNYTEEAALAFFNSDTATQRLMFQAQVTTESMQTNGRGEHHDLIELALRHYAPHAHPGFTPIYIDNADGDRIDTEEIASLANAGIQLAIDDSYPDIILYNENQNSLWFIEAVCSDGEVDQTKLDNLHEFCRRFQKNFAGATTVYTSWKTYARRQATNLNIALNTHVWVAQDPSRIHYIKSTLPS